MTVSIEVPVFKGQFLQRCIDSVLNQTSDAWRLSLVWDGGDSLSREILERIKNINNPKIDVYFTPNQGIARARAFLSGQNNEEYILPLDDDDELAANAVEVFINTARAKPWASLIRAKRGFIDENSEIVDEKQWFPFGPRNYYKGMVKDVFNQAQPYLIRRTAYERTLGWRGFDDFMQAGEDCDIFLQLEQIAHFELVDEVLYHYRLHNKRASDALTSAAAFEMWRRLADDTLQRIGLPLVRTNDRPPFTYQTKEPTNSTLENVEFVVRYNSPLIGNLKQLGITEKSIIETPVNADNLIWKMAGFHASTKALICFVDDTVRFTDPSALTELVAILNKSHADVLTPNFCINQENSPNQQYTAFNITEHPWLHADCILVRREVVLATGGFDEQFIAKGLQNIDFYIQACHRDFSCREASIKGINYHNSFRKSWKEEDVIQLQKKWNSHGFFSGSIKEFSKVSGEGAR